MFSTLEFQRQRVRLTFLFVPPEYMYKYHTVIESLIKG